MFLYVICYYWIKANSLLFCIHTRIYENCYKIHSFRLRLIPKTAVVVSETIKCSVIAKILSRTQISYCSIIISSFILFMSVGSSLISNIVLKGPTDTYRVESCLVEFGFPVPTTTTTTLISRIRTMFVSTTRQSGTEVV